MEKEKSCGGIIYYDFGSEIKFLLIKHKKSRYWGFPKGHVDNNETEVQTATREIKEEVGLDVEILDGFRKVITFSPKKETIKDVVFFIAKAKSSDVKYIFDEVSSHLWLSYEKAIKKLTHKESVDLLSSAFEFISKDRK